MNLLEAAYHLQSCRQKWWDIESESSQNLTDVEGGFR